MRKLNVIRKFGNKYLLNIPEYFVKHTNDCIGSQVYELFKDNERIGLIELPAEINYHTKENNKLNIVQHLYVSEKYRNCGYGSFLIGFVSDQLKDKGFRTLEVNSTKRSIPFYQKNGFIGIDNKLTKLFMM